MESIENLKKEELQLLAGKASRQAADCVQQGDLQHGEQLYLKALRAWDEIYQQTGEQSDGAAAGEICEILADICMQQGNMHGADVYYVRALGYRNTECRGGKTVSSV